MSIKHDRRSVLRGAVQGAAVTVALPFLDCFLNENGTALASTGAPLPVRFGTWFWGLGITPERWIPTKIGKDYDLPVELKYIEPFKDQINVLSGFDVKIGAKTNIPHQTGLFGALAGECPLAYNETDLPTIDVLISDAIGKDSRFRSLELSATGNVKDSYSRRGRGIINPSEVSPVAFYTRVFGPEFQDPNSADFRPSPEVMLRKSVLSAVKEDRDDLAKSLGSADRARLDEYFTSLRQLEGQLQMELERPPPAEACSIPPKPSEVTVGYEIDQVIKNHQLLTKLLAMALACNQTKVFNMIYSNSASEVRLAGSAVTHHIYTHEEPINAELGYQVQATWFVERSMEAWADFVRILASVREGDGTLLDNSLVFAHSDTSFAKSHSVFGIPIMLAGKAGGRVRTGLHLNGNSEPVTRVGLTLQQIMGLKVDSWGGDGMPTSRPITEILA